MDNNRGIGRRLWGENRSANCALLTVEHRHGSFGSGQALEGLGRALEAERANRMLTLCRQCCRGRHGGQGGSLYVCVCLLLYVDSTDAPKTVSIRFQNIVSPILCFWILLLIIRVEDVLDLFLDHQARILGSNNPLSSFLTSTTHQLWVLTTTSNSAIPNIRSSAPFSKSKYL